MNPHIIAGPAKWAESDRARFDVRAEAIGPIEVNICGYIGNDYWDESSMGEARFLEALKGYDQTRDLDILINSHGGSVKDGLGIYNAIKRWQGKTTARITGFACSIASVIPLACDRVVSPKSSNWMIHDPLCMTAGNAADHQKSIEMLESCAATMAAIYAEKTGKTRKEMRAVMKAETWLTGEEAKAFGLSDEVNDDPVDLKVTEAINEFRNVPERLVAMLTKKTNPPPTAAGQPTGDKVQKDKILALLKQHGKNVSADASDETILAMLGDLVAAGKVGRDDAEKLKKSDEKVLISRAELEAMTSRFNEERQIRIRNEFRALAEDRKYLDESEWLPKLYADESLMENVRKMPVMSGTKPVEFSTIENKGNSLIEKYHSMEPGAERSKFATAHWNELQAAHKQHHIQQVSSMSVGEQLKRLHDPQAANTYNATLVTDRLSDQVITTIGVKLAPLAAFSREVGVDPLKPRATVDVEKVMVGSTTQTNATNFEQSDTTTVATQVAVDQVTQNWGCTNDELNKGHKLMTKAEKNAQAFANAISDKWTALVTTGNFGTAINIGAAETFEPTDLAPILAAGKNYSRVNLILDGGHLAYLLATDKFKFRLGEDGAYDFDLIAKQNRWTGATANTAGFVCDPNAIACASGLPLSMPEQEFLELSTTTIPQLGITILVCHWWSRGGRQHFMSYDVMIGFKEGDTTAGEVLLAA